MGIKKYQKGRGERGREMQRKDGKEIKTNSRRIILGNQTDQKLCGRREKKKRQGVCEMTASLTQPITLDSPVSGF